MKTSEAYDLWANQYDTNINKTRDLEALALRDVLKEIQFSICLEIGCGTGKNTEWFIPKAKKIVGIDLSEKMLQKAKEKIKGGNVQFMQADITKDWAFNDQLFDLISFSLVLEHIENLDDIFRKASHAMVPGGYLYIGELHPFKQYTGSKARFETEEGLQIVNCYNHHISDFTLCAIKHDFEIVKISEFFDDDDRKSLPRILAILFKKI